MEAHNRRLIQLIDKDGIFQNKNLKNFIDESNQFSKCGFSYLTISIMGAQSSGKSTLLNSLFGCAFEVMDADKGRNQTTKGIWVAKSVSPCRIIIDTEGSDGEERGLDDTKFEKQSALFTLMISDVIILNMWHKDIGRVNGSGLPLLQIIFQERMRLQDKHGPPSRKRLFVILRDSPSKNHKAVRATLDQILRNIKEERMRLQDKHGPPSRKRLLVILRDSPSKNHKGLRAALDQILSSIKTVWDSVAQRVGENTALADYFELDAIPLPDYENCRDDFDAKVAELRRQLSEPIATAGDRFPILGLSQGIEKIWTAIQNNDNLDMPSFLELVSRERCRTIFKRIVDNLIEDYKKLSKALVAASLPNFRGEMAHLLDSCLQEYHTESKFYDMKISAELAEGLKSKLFEIMECLYEEKIWHIANDELKLFKDCTTRSKEIDTKMKSSLEEFEKKCAKCAIPNAGWSCSQVKQSLEVEMKNHESEIRKKEAAVREENIQVAMRFGLTATRLAVRVVILILTGNDIGN